RAAADRWQAWCLRLDADADPPTWKKHRLGELSASERRRGALLGPIRDKDAAGRLGEAMDDLFDLCRYPVELAKAPSGMACAYHEMGRCPAPCDGSEPMDAYRARVREAIETVCGDLAPERASAEAEMRAAAGRQDFERAARLKARVERLRSIDGFAYKWLGRVERLRVIALLPAERDGWVRVMAIAAGRWRVIADVDAVEGPRGAPGMVDAIVEADRWLHAADTTLTDDACDALGLIAGYLYSKPKLTRGGFVRRTDDTPIGELSPELWSACRSALKAGEPDAEAPDRELGAG
ncbi:MAG: UvrB/UvrC motif-containing protein, partial [Planctomycetota bacterium]